MVSAGDSAIDGIVVNESPRPRLLVMGFLEDESLVASILDLAPTHRHIGGLEEVRLAEWDVLVTDQRIYSGGKPDRHLCVIYVGRPSDSAWNTVEDRRSWAGRIEFGGRSVARELKRVRGLPERIASLVHDRLEPVVKRREVHCVFRSLNLPRTSGLGSGGGASPAIEPFIATADDGILAGRYSRSQESEAWLLPHDAPELAAWVRAAIAEWHGLAPHRFPGIPDWSRMPDWMTPAERAIRGEMDKLEEERQEFLQRLEVRQVELRLQFDQERDSADAYERALLTAQSDELKAAVIKALREVGFVVTDADEAAAADDHLEDLHICDPSAPGWIALGEVKGYSKGAKTEALTQFIRFHGRYVQRVGALPNASWYVVNQFLARDPASRQPALHGKEEDIAAFAAAGGLVIDTTVLFKLLVDVCSGGIAADYVRERLRSSVGRLTYPL